MDLPIKPILSALRRHKAGTVLIALQIALTLAVVCNALFIVHERIERVRRPTGVVEDGLIAVQTRYVGSPTSFVPLVQTDLQALRSLPGVRDAYATNSYPLRGGGRSIGVQTDPDKETDSVEGTVYAADEHALATLGVTLVAGRNFLSSEVVPLGPQQPVRPAQVMLSRAMADKLFPKGDALGKAVYLVKGAPSIVIGIIDRLTVPWLDFEGRQEFSLVMPAIMDTGIQFFLLRVDPRQTDAVMKAIPDRLYQVNRMRIIPAKGGVRSFAEVRAHAYEADRGMAMLMTVVCLVLLGITAAGIVGLSSFWVAQRRRQIGVRRALGARRRDILAYFMAENFLIAAAGVVVGACLAATFSQWLFLHFQMRQLSATYLLVGAVLLLLLGQLSVLAPALRASRVPPAEAVRSV